MPTALFLDLTNLTECFRIIAGTTLALFDRLAVTSSKLVATSYRVNILYVATA